MEHVDPYLSAELSYRREELTRAWQSPLRLPFSKSRSQRPSGPTPSGGHRLVVAR